MKEFIAKNLSLVGFPDPAEGPSFKQSSLQLHLISAATAPISMATLLAYMM